MTSSERAVLIEWLETEFLDACNNDKKRLLEAAWMLKVGIGQGDSIEGIMAHAIASFVRGLILGEQPITVPTESN